jgi:hypothetical protein
MKVTDLQEGIRYAALAFAAESSLPSTHKNVSDAVRDRYQDLLSQ